ncbi:hypothetical protein ABPG77_004646 [Micractinium sp. CCAP 211/92]
MPQPAAETARNAAAAVAALLATETPLLVSPADSDERPEQLAAAAACLEAQQARASEETARLTKHRGALHAQLEEQCCKAEARQETVAAAVHALAGRIACLVQSRNGEPSALLGAHLPDGYAAACQTLLDSLAGYLQHNFPTAEPPASSHAAANAQAAMLELEQLQRFQIKADQLHIQDEAEIARLQAELEMLQAQAVTAGAASLGYSTADLRAEVASLERRRDAALHAALAQAEGAAAAAAGAEVVREQAAVRRALLEQRLHAKQQVAGMLARHLGRQLLVQQLVRQERAVLREVEATAAAARQDVELVLQMVQARLPGYRGSRAMRQGEQSGQPSDAVRQQDSLAAPVARQQDCLAAPVAQQQDAQPSNPVATAQQLLACRARLQELAEQTRAQALPAHRAVLAKLYGLLYSSSGSGTDGYAATAASCGAAGSQGDGQSLPELELSPPELHQQLAAVAQAEAALSLQANALLEEVIARQQAPAERQLAETVLCWFWTQPERLSALAEKHRRQLATYTAA